VRSPGDAGPGPRLGDIVAERLTELGAAPDDARWDSRKRADGNWQVQLIFAAGGRSQVAEWVFDPRRRHVAPDDDQAARLCLPAADLPAMPAAARAPATATVTPIAPRLGSVSAHHLEPRAPAAPSAPAAVASPAAAGSQAGREPDADRVPAERDSAASAEASPHAEPARERTVRKAAGGRSRRASVPSWDEIMFGNSRQPE
jgi:hypothetical protein